MDINKMDKTWIHSISKWNWKTIEDKQIEEEKQNWHDLQWHSFRIDIKDIQIQTKQS